MLPLVTLPQARVEQMQKQVSSLPRSLIVCHTCLIWFMAEKPLYEAKVAKGKTNYEKNAVEDDGESEKSRSEVLQRSLMQMITLRTRCRAMAKQGDIDDKGEESDGAYTPDTLMSVQTMRWPILGWKLMRTLLRMMFNTTLRLPNMSNIVRLIHLP
ncbi:hypothetical protein Tco_1324140 [Tanacetum coccineum]